VDTGADRRDAISRWKPRPALDEALARVRRARRRVAPGGWPKSSSVSRRASDH
jgi:hypothetical protein